MAFAQDRFTLTGANPNGNANGDVYVSPYTATITSGRSTLYSGEVICDDFEDEVTVGESWYVSPSPASAVTSGLFANQADYDAVAWLAMQLVALPLTDATDQAIYSYAIWTIFDPTAINSYVGNTSDVTNLINEALSQNYSGAGVTVWTPTSWTSAGRPQEFLTVQTPEASLLASLAIDLSAVVGLVFLMRRRLVRT
jgi:hypothetical protein